jgi:deoxyadenosine/deoxycytidine kinase
VRNIFITGNIGSGKSTLMQLAAANIANACAIPEPYEANPFLPLYLQDQKRWAFTSTLHYFHDYVRIFAETTAGKNYRFHFIDAGMWTNSLVYAEYTYREQRMTAEEYAFYQTLCGVIEEAYNNPEPDGFIFVNASPQTCWERMHRRGWAYQTSTIQLSYIETLHTYFEAMKRTIASKGFPLLEVSSEAIDYSQGSGEREVLALVERFLQINQSAHT